MWMILRHFFDRQNNSWWFNARRLQLQNNSLPLLIGSAKRTADLSLSSLIIPAEKTEQGVLVKSVSALWSEIVAAIGSDWSEAFRIGPERWEEIIAGAFKKAGYDDVTLTPRSGDHGRDVIAVKRGFGCVKIIGSVKAFAPGNLVSYDAVRALVGVMTGEADVSKGIITTTSDFPPKIRDDPFLKPFIPTRLELLNGSELKRWLERLQQRTCLEARGTRYTVSAAPFHVSGHCLRTRVRCRIVNRMRGRRLIAAVNMPNALLRSLPAHSMRSTWCRHSFTSRPCSSRDRPRSTAR
jgi:restriction system protein